MKTKVHTNAHLILLILALLAESVSLFGSATEIVIFLTVILFEFIYFAIENEIIKFPNFPKPALVKAEINTINPHERKEL